MFYAGERHCLAESPAISLEAYTRSFHVSLYPWSCNRPSFLFQQQRTDIDQVWLTHPTVKRQLEFSGTPVLGDDNRFCQPT